MENCLQGEDMKSRAETGETAVQLFGCLGCLGRHRLYSLSLPKQPIYPFPGYVSCLHPVHIQSISVIRPAVLAGEIGPYKQIGPVSSTLVERESKYTISEVSLTELSG